MIEVVQPVAAGTNVIDVGEDVARNDILLPAGHRIRPQDIGLLAGLGLVRTSRYFAGYGWALFPPATR